MSLNADLNKKVQEVIFSRTMTKSFHSQCICRNLKLNQATKFEGNDWVVISSFPYPLNKVNDLLLSHFPYFFLIFHYFSC